ncbi:unnamed protein product [Rotaria sp. Silwood2]|nr:unnamed protein product [Rotaria sp. Silwood2]CAF4439242.1 unnamed protein product [Rotaria sp. Silwood2]CAF4812332.1 unnamed protein product [Rotaria sp. Silwood2]
MLSDNHVDQRLILSKSLDNPMKYLLSNQRQTFIAGSILFSNMYSSFRIFKPDDLLHPQSTEINNELDRMAVELIEHGHNLYSSWIPRKIREAKIRESTALYHAERLALAFNLIQRPVPSIIQLTTNLRICPDCRKLFLQ